MLWAMKTPDFALTTFQFWWEFAYIAAVHLIDVYTKNIWFTSLFWTIGIAREA